MPAAQLYALPASHPCATVERAFALKDVPLRRIDLVPVAHVPLQLLRFGGRTVPGVVFPDGMRVQGSRAILRELELRAPEPPLLPAGGAARAGVEAAEAWGDVVLQSAARRIIWAALRRAPEAAESLSEGADLPVPPALARASMPLIVRLETALNGAWDANARADLAALPGHLDRIEAWMGEGALGGEAPTAADLQIGPALALLHTLEDLHPLLDRRACEPARRWFAGQPGRVPAGTLPAAWLPARLRQ